MTILDSNSEQFRTPPSGTIRNTPVTVLLVADDEQFGSTVAQYLEQEFKYEVETATTATEALERLHECTHISCIVAEDTIPDMDDLEFLRNVTTQYPKVPFILFAGASSDRVASKAFEIGATDYLEKDTSEARYELLGRRIRRCVTSSRQQQELQDLYGAIEAAGHAMLVTDTDGTITYANPTMEAISGYTREELLGATPAILQSGKHDQAFYQDLWSTVLSGNVWEGHVVNERKNGEQYVIDQTISPVTSDGEITGFVAINREITEQKARKRDLEFFEQAFDQVGTCIAAYDDSGTIQYVNEAYANMLETGRRQLIGETITDVNPEFDNDRFRDYWNSFDTGTTRRRETVHEKPETNETLPVETVTTHITVDDTAYHVGTIQDISKRKEREQRLKKFYEAVEQTGHAVFITDTDGTIEYVNPAFETITGYERNEAIGKTPALLKSGAHDQAFYQDLWSTILGGEVWRGEIINERKDGSEYIIQQTISPVVDGDDITHFVAINHDITERRQQQRELEQQNEQLERQNERLEQFGQTVAHDLRNPLAVMDGYLDVAKETDNSEEAHEKIQQSISRMSELIDELLMLAKQGKTVLEPSAASLEDVATTAWEHVDTCQMDLIIDDDVQLMMDESRVVELFENLIRNAREHADDSTTVRVGPLSDGFYIEDNGPGIPPEKRDDVLVSGVTTSKDGTGFGLAIVTQIVKAHSWTVSITDGSDGGARFDFRSVDYAEKSNS